MRLLLRRTHALYSSPGLNSQVPALGSRLLSHLLPLWLKLDFISCSPYIKVFYAYALLLNAVFSSIPFIHLFIQLFALRLGKYLVHCYVSQASLAMQLGGWSVRNMQSQQQNTCVTAGTWGEDLHVLGGRSLGFFSKTSTEQISSTLGRAAIQLSSKHIILNLNFIWKLPSWHHHTGVWTRV